MKWLYKNNCTSLKGECNYFCMATSYELFIGLVICMKKWTRQVNESACDSKENKKEENISRVIAGDKTFSNAYGNTCHII